MGWDKIITVPLGRVEVNGMATGLTIRNRLDTDIPGVVTRSVPAGSIGFTGLAPAVNIFQAPEIGPTAAASVSPTSVLVGQLVTLFTSGTHAGSVPITSWSIAWGDSSTSSGPGAPPSTVAHSYLLAGNYTPILTVTDSNNRSDSATAQTVGVGVSQPSGVLQPSDFTYIGCCRMPTNWTLASIGGMTGRTVAGRDRIIAYGLRSWYKMVGAVSAASSSSSFSFTVSSASGGGAPAIGQRISIAPVAGLVQPQSTVIQNVSGSGPYTVTVSPALSAPPTVGDYVWHDDNPIIEVEIPTSGFTSDYATTVQATLIGAWPDPYLGKKVSWREGAVHQVSGDPGFRFPAGLYFNEATGMLFWTSFDPYGGAGGVDQQDWELGASVLGAPSVIGGTDGAVASYGPWRTTCLDGDGNTWYGTWRFGFLARKPNGSFLGGCIVHSGALAVAYGPSLFGGVFPTTATPGGPSAANLPMNDRYANYYFPGQGSGNYYNPDGSLVGTIRQFQHTKPAGYSIIFEPNYFPVRNGINPAFNNGIATWNGVTDACSGALWLTGPNTNSVLFAAALTTGPATDPTNPTGPHVWYQSSGQYTIDVSSVSGFQPFEAVLGLTSGATVSAESIVSAGAGGFAAKIAGACTVGQDFIVGETVQGQTSLATATVLHTNRHSVCYHGFAGSAGITGDVFLRAFPAIVILDGNRLEQNKAGSAIDYTTSASDIIDLEATFGLQSAPLQNVGSGKQVWGFYYNPSTRRLYLTAPQADLTLGTNNPQTLIHIFEIRSGAL